MRAKADLVVDLQYGSTGKGLFCGWLGATRGYDAVINANMPNAGHTYIDRNGNQMVHKVLPSGIVSENLKYVLLGPGSVFDPAQLSREIEQGRIFGYLKGARVVVHPNAVVLQERHRQIEGASSNNIGSTKQGAGAALAEKIARPTGVGLLASHFKGTIEAAGARVVDVAAYRAIIDGAAHILMEGAQGYSLGLHQRFWPYTTSRECTPARFASDMMMPLGYIRSVYGVARVHPIRVGGTSGDCYPDQIEATWEDLGQTPELTTVTKKVRRVFTFSHTQFQDAIWECCPNHVFLNFVNYDEEAADRIIKRYGDLVKWIGIGPNHDDVRERVSYYGQ